MASQNSNQITHITWSMTVAVKSNNSAMPTGHGLMRSEKLTKAILKQREANHEKTEESHLLMDSLKVLVTRQGHKRRKEKYL